MLDDEMVRIIEEMRNVSPGSDEYRKLRNDLAAMAEIRDMLTEAKAKARKISHWWLDPAFLGVVLNGTLGLGIIFQERIHTFTTRAFAFMRR